MRFIRKSLVAGFASLLTIVLIAFAISVGAMRVIDKPSNVKQALANSGVYNTVVPNALKETGSISTPAGSIPLNDPQITAAAEKSLPASDIKDYSNQIIDSIYAWLNGRTASPDFSIGFSAPRDRLATNVAAVVSERAARLPVCTSLAAIMQASGNVYDASCLPPGVSATQVADQVKNQINAQQDFLGQGNINANSVKSSSSSSSVFNNELKNLPKYYQRLKKLPYELAAAAVLLGIGVVALSSRRGRGLRRVGFSLASAGIVTVILGWTFGQISSRFIEPHVSLNNTLAQTDIRRVVASLAQTIEKNYLVIGGIYLIAALAFIFAENILSFLSHKLNHDSDRVLSTPVDIDKGA